LTIKHLAGSLAGRSQRVVLQEDQRLRLGRAPGSDISFSDTLDDSVSGSHAEISLQQGRVYVEDKRSSNGTFVNGERCVPFQSIAVPDGARIRLGKEGPELQLLIEAAPATARSAATAAPATGAFAQPVKESIGRTTMLREIDSARQEERNIVSGQLASSRRSTGIWVTLGLLFVVLLTAMGIGAASWWNRKQLDQKGQLLSQEVSQVGRQATAASNKASENVWAAIQSRVSPAVVHIRCIYRIHFPKINHVDAKHQLIGTNGEAIYGDGVEGSGVLVRPGLVLTARHLAEPWRSQFDSWDELARKYDAKPEYDLIDVQFPGGQQPLKAALVASSEESDLALLQIQPTNAQAVTIVKSNDDVKITDRIAVISYPGNLGKQLHEIHNQSGAGSEFKNVLDVAPTFVTGTITQGVASPADKLSFDASVTHGSSGGAVLNDRGELIGIVSALSLQPSSIILFGKPVPASVPMSAGNQAISPKSIQNFLRTHGFS
jgi:S1-C subfamily serine protease